jgi:dTDP-4-amino-4,6-dideoxygalactose transaminase
VSGATAIFLIILSLKEKLNNNIILTNSFTFNAVPSAIIHANLECVLVETTENLTIDIVDLENKIIETKSNCIVLSYMRGFIPNMDTIVKSIIFI